MPIAVSPWNVTAQDPVRDRVQVVELNDPPVAPALKVNVTVPEGTRDAAVVSVTVAVHDEVWPKLIEPGAQAIVVEVLSGFTVIVAETEEELVP